MEYDVVLFNTMANYPIVAKTAGAYKIASSLREEGYSVKVLDHYSEFLFDVGDLTKKYLECIDNISSSKTFLVGISTTWFQEHIAPVKASFTDIQFEYFFVYLKTKFPNAKIVIGGYTENSRKIYSKFSNYIDYWLHGLADYTIKNLCKQLKENTIIKDRIIYSRDSIENFSSCSPTFSSQDNIAEGETLPIELSRGCRFKCKFCSFYLIGKNPNDNKYIRNYDSMYAEFKNNYENWKTTNYSVLCDTFNETTDKLLSVMQVLNDLKININFAAYIRLDLLYYHREQISILKDLGARSVFFGIESLHDPSSKAVGKGLGKKKTLEMLNLLKKEWGNNIRLHGHFITGLPHETEKTATAWLEELINGDIPLDTWRVQPLEINLNHVFTSEFERNYASYGYRIEKEGEWETDSWSFQGAKKLAEAYLKRYEQYSTPLPWDWMALKNYNWPEDKISSIRNFELRRSPTSDVINSKFKFLENYINKEVN